MKRQVNRTFLESSESSHIPPLDNQGVREKRFDVGYLYEIDHLNRRTPSQLKLIRVVMVTEKTKLNVSLRYPSIQSLCSFLCNSKMSITEIYPFLDEVFVMEIHLAGKVLCRQISAQEFDDDYRLQGFWLIKNSLEPAALRGIFNKETTQLKSNGTVLWGIRRQVKFLNKQGDSSTSYPRSSSRLVKGTKEKLVHESDEDEDVEEDDTDEDYKISGKRKRYSLRQNTKKANKGKCFVSSYKKTRRNECIKMMAGTSINRWPAESLYDLRLEARKRIGDTGQLGHLLKPVTGKLAPGGAERFQRRHNADGQMESANLVEVRKDAGMQDPYRTPPPDTGQLGHLLKPVTGKLAPGGAERFQRRHNADGQMEDWLESANLVEVAVVQDPYRTPPPGWTPGDRPSQDPICAKELSFARIKREMDEQFKKLHEELSNISGSIMEMKDQIGTLSSMVGHTSNRTRNQAALETRQAVAVVKESVSTGEKTAAEGKAAKLEKLNSGFRISKPQGTLLWPNMAPNNGSSPVEVQVHTAPFVSSSTTSAPPQLPYHHPPTYTIRPVPERARTLTVKTAPGSKSTTNLMNLSDIPDTYAAFTTARHVSIAFRIAATKRHLLRSPSYTQMQ